jgi:hypothetical protein
MSMEEFYVNASHLAFGAIATFFAILLWSKTRDMAWILVILGTVVSYAEIVFTTLRAFGIIDETFLAVSGVPVARMVLVNLPPLLYSAGFLSAVLRRRLP